MQTITANNYPIYFNENAYEHLNLFFERKQIF